MVSTSRRSSGRAGGPATRGGQSTISFGSRGKVTKPVTGAADSKSKKKDDFKSEEPEVAEIKPTDPSEEQDEQESLTRKAILQQEEEGKAERASSAASQEEIEARKIKDKQIREYWKGIEAERRAPRVHQNDLGLHEKILRHFDLSSQYGPCIGIGRTRRWNRANRLNLHPPMEVLAILLKEEDAQREQSERAYVDELMA